MPLIAKMRHNCTLIHGPSELSPLSLEGPYDGRRLRKFAGALLLCRSSFPFYTLLFNQVGDQPFKLLHGLQPTVQLALCGLLVFSNLLKNLPAVCHQHCKSVFLSPFLSNEPALLAQLFLQFCLCVFYLIFLRPYLANIYLPLLGEASEILGPDIKLVDGTGRKKKLNIMQLSRLIGRGNVFRVVAFEEFQLGAEPIDFSSRGFNAILEFFLLITKSSDKPPDERGFLVVGIEQLKRGLFALLLLLDLFFKMPDLFAYGLQLCLTLLDFVFR